MNREFCTPRLRWLVFTVGGIVLLSAVWQLTQLRDPAGLGNTAPRAFPADGVRKPQDGKAGGTTAAPPTRSRIRTLKGPPQDAPPIGRPVDSAGLIPTPQKLVARLSHLDLSGGPLTREVAALWQEDFRQLVQRGPAALPAIRAYLETFTDVAFGPAGMRKLGHGSARTALIGALVEIGGSEALAVTLEMMRLTAEPPEIALLAANLERLAPEQPDWRGAATQAAREALTLAASGPPGDQDVAPLFEVLNRYGGISAVPHLEQASGNWNYYASMALAQLPDGAGVPSLVRMAQEQKGTIPVQMLAQLATANPVARNALLELAGMKMIPSSAWPHLQSVLEGQQCHFSDSFFDESGDTASLNGMTMVHIAKGNQNYYVTMDATRLSNEHIDQQMGLVDALEEVVEDPGAAMVLKEAKRALTLARAAVAETHSLIGTPRQ